jgi:hypothetical protein
VNSASVLRTVVDDRAELVALEAISGTIGHMKARSLT